MSNPVISTTRVIKTFGPFRLGPVNLEIEPGYVVGIVGPNGSGKTTLFRMLMNLATPDSGQIEIFGERYPEQEAEIKQRIGYVPEAPIGYEEMTGSMLGEFVSFWYPGWNQNRYDDLLKKADIPGDKPYSKLSKGMKRRVSFALARSSEADLLLLDEPTAGVDPFARRDMIDEISDYMQDGERTVLMATHAMDEIRRLCDYILLIHDGKFIGYYEKDALQEQWRSIWVDRVPQGSVPGLVQIDQGTPIRLVTNAPAETQEALRREGVQIIRSQPIDLEEILAFMMRERVPS